MTLTFFWSSNDGSPTPECRSASRNAAGVSPLECLLIDDGGQGHSASVAWLEEGVRMIRAVQLGELDHGHWSRNAWGADLNRERTRIYSLYDDACAETLPLDAFEKALTAWIRFVRSRPDAATSETVAL